ncbi:MAG: hypothetical protein JRN27_03515 [Nitrososphaerota archaeon]|nr:hypothetical protein [Nitrososphaerota archaeon]MDG6975149.1 hypothetical protein [Nitrososphaerota archaeon]
MALASRLVVGTAAVVLSMAVLFTVPPGYFVAATFLATGCMVASAYSLGALGTSRKASARAVAAGLLSALLLYLIFVAGAAGISAFHPFGMTAADEASIYALITSSSTPSYLQVAVLLSDAAGFESFFRGVLQQKLTPRFGTASAFVVALFDAGIHAISLNPLWVGATFVTDLAWGLTFRYGGGKQASFVSHLIWDIAIFIVRPVT